MWSFIWRQTSDRLAGLARVLIVGILVAACGIGDQGDGGGVLPPPPPANLALFAGNLGGAGNIDGTGAEARFDTPSGVATDSSGNVYVADTYSHTIRKITPAGAVTTLAGRAGVAGSADGTGADARFASPEGVATDSTGNLYVADTSNHAIRKITPAGVVTTLAGRAGVPGSADGTGADARFNHPAGVATDSAGNVYVADSGERFRTYLACCGSHVIRKITPEGAVSTLAGSAAADEGSADGTGADARFADPSGIATDSAGNVYVADRRNHTIRKITPGREVTTLAGRAGVTGSADGTGVEASFYDPSCVATDSAGNVYVGDSSNHTIRKITPAGVVTTLVGRAGVPGSADGTGADARFSEPGDVTTDRVGNVYVADSGNHTIRMITPAGVVTTLAGSAEVKGGADGIGAEARFASPEGVATDTAGNVYVADRYNQKIRLITPAGVVTTLAGSAGIMGSADGTGADARFRDPRGVATDLAGNVYVADYWNHMIRKITPAGVATTLAGSAEIKGSADGIGAEARFAYPEGVATDSAGNVYVGDSVNHTIRKITPAGVVTTLAGSAEVSGSADGIGGEARFAYPSGIATDSAGNVFVADTLNHTIRKITPDGLVSTLAGHAGVTGSADGAGVEARFASPRAVAIDSAGNVYVADLGNSTIRKITPAGVVSTAVGAAGLAGFKSGALPGALHQPRGVAVRGTTLYVTLYNGAAAVTNVR